jgi:acetyltransferase
MTIRSLQFLLAPKTVALIGASPEPGSIGKIIANHLRGGGFAGPAWLVNPRHSQIDGERCFASVDVLPGVPDLAVIATPPATILELIADLGRKGTRAAVVISAGVTPTLRQAMLDIRDKTFHGFLAVDYDCDTLGLSLLRRHTEAG